MSDRIVITRPLPADPVGRLAGAGLRDVWINPRDELLDRAALRERIPGAAAVIVTPADSMFDDELLDAAGPQLRIVSAYAVGVDNIDVAACARRGVLVGHTPHAVTEPTADVAWLLLLAAARQARAGLERIRAGQWTGFRPTDCRGRRLIDKTLLIVGAGKIGHATARRALGWNMRLLYTARSRHEEFEAEPLRARRVSLEEGLAEADFVSLHTPLTEETRHLIGAEQLRLMKPTAVLVNTARGPVVDEAALATALRDGTIFAAGLDVYEREPEIYPELLQLENVFLLPHWGSATDEDRAWMCRIAVDNVVAALRGEPLPHEFPRP
ncbi:MAG: 2-hydroxyacid dehydrogenase [Planctomycetota bacterium]|jgi:glyoxylate reductase